LDQGVPRDAASRFRELRYECTHVGEIGMGNAADAEILTWALKKGAVVVTLDADFHTILAVSGASGPSVIRLRMQGVRAAALVELIQQVLAVFGEDLKKGALVTIKARKTTCHSLPIGSST
jgi:predicted nuclease of predicted toxin-antitoxin system